LTRPKADSDPWLTDPVSRDRVIAKTVVSGMREIIVLLRGIRDGQADEIRALRRDNAHLRTDLIAAYRELAQVKSSPNHVDPGYPPCEKEGCPLPRDHYEPHRGSLRSMG
jgi:hypothetical protein